MAVELQDFSWNRMIDAVEAVQERARRTAAALGAAKIPYAVIGGNAVAAWVARVDRAAVRNTQDVDILVRREDLPAMVNAMQAAGFLYRHVKGIDFFTDHDETRFRHGVHLIFAGEKVRTDDLLPTAEVSESEPGPEYQIVTLEALVRMKLSSFRTKDRVHLDDLIRVGLIDETWKPRLPTELTTRLETALTEFEPDPDNLIE